MPTVRRDGTDLVIELRVQPRAGRTGFAGVHGERLRVRLAAPPVDGRANAELVDFLADSFGVPRSRVAFEHGLSGRDKRVRIHDPATIPEPIRTLLGRG